MSINTTTVVNALAVVGAIHTYKVVKPIVVTSKLYRRLNSK